MRREPKAFEPDQLQHLIGADVALGLADLAHGKAETDIGPHAHMREQRIILKHGRGRSARRRQCRHVSPSISTRPSLGR